MPRRRKRHIKILGHRFHKAYFWRWVVCILLFFAITIISLFAFYLLSEQKQKTVWTDYLNQEKATQSFLPLKTGSTELDLLIDQQRSAIGADTIEGLIVKGQIIRGTEPRAFRDYWSSPNKMRREWLREGQVTEVFTDNGQQVLRITPEGVTDLSDTLEGAFFRIEASLYDPLASYNEEKQHYSLLFDENVDGRLNKVIGYRLPGTLLIRHFFDKATLWESRRLVWLIGQEQGQREIRFNNYQRSAGRTLPYEITFWVKGEVVETILIETIQREDPFSDSVFKPVLLLKDETSPSSTIGKRLQTAS